MIRRAKRALAAVVLVTTAVGPFSSSSLSWSSSWAAMAPQPPPVTTIHAVFAASDTPQTDVVHKQFTAAVNRRDLGPVEVMDMPGPPPPKAKELLGSGRAAVEGKRFAEAEKALLAASADVKASGGDGVTSAELGDIFLYLGMALQQADWKDPPVPFTEITPAAAKDAYLQAATLVPDRTLLPRQFPPLAIASWKLALAEVDKRGRGNLIVRVPSTALVAVDAGPLKSGSLPSLGLRQGRHFVRVEDPGRRPHGTTIELQQPALEWDVPAQPVLTLSDASAALAARRQGAAFALVAELRPGSPATVELRLIHAQTAARRDATTVTVSDPSALEAGVIHLEEVARKVRFDDSQAAVITAPALGDIALAPVAPRPAVESAARLTDSPRAWAKARWPLLTAVGVAVGSALVLGVLVAHDDGR